MRNFIVGVAFVLSLTSFTNAQELLAPDPNMSAKRVVEIQLIALQQNDSPSVDAGIVQTWNFAHPDNKRYTGPLARFAAMVKSPYYRDMINHSQHTIKSIVTTNQYALFKVTIISKENVKSSFKWELMKAKTGTLNGAWMTTSVSPPLRVEGSI
tara:strand:+ start:1594 stop:2055 length:462 start_codon:yes stop_codon:yes gene_type:complete